MTLKLYKVTLRGMNTGFPMIHGIGYVIAHDPNEAYKIMRDDLTKRDIGFIHNRELLFVELLAENILYPYCGIRLYLPDNAAEVG